MLKELLNGRANMVICLNDGAISDRKDPQFKKLMHNFLVGENTKIISIDRCRELFRGIQQLPDDFDEINRNLNCCTTYKFNKCKRELIICRISLLIAMGYVEGTQLIQCFMRIIQLKKEIFVLELEQGNEVFIPQVLS